MKSKPMSERLLAKLITMMPKRKAEEVAKGLKSTVSRAPVKGTVTQKLVARLLVLGISERKAPEVAKKLAPLVRSAIKAKALKKAMTLDDVDDTLVNQTVAEVTDTTEDAELDKVAPRVNGHRVRLDLPVVRRSSWMSAPVKGVELLRVIDGLTSEGTYLIAAVKGELGMVAVRQFNPDSYNVKFYPDMEYWSRTREGQVESHNASNHLKRQWYERMYYDRKGLDQLCKKLAAEAKPKSRMKALIDRFKSVTGAPLVKAFDYLHKRVNVAA